MEKIIYIDIDGTILDKNKKLGEITKEAIINVQKKGVKVVLATGRTFSEITKVAQILQLDKNSNLSICCNGAYITKTNEFTPFNVNALKENDAKKIVQFLTDEDIKAFVIDYKKPEVYFSNAKVEKFETDQAILPNMKVLKIDETFNWNNVTMIAFASPKEQLKTFEDFLNKKEFEINYICSKSSHREKPLFMVGYKQTSKLSAIKYLNKKFNIKDEDVYVFGDGINDVDMIKEYKSNAFVPESAPDYVKAVAQNIIGSPNDDGVGKKIVELFNLSF